MNKKYFGNELTEKEKVLSKFKNAKYFNVEVQEYNTGHNRNYYFDKVDNIYEEFSDNIDELEFLKDQVSIIRDNHNYNTDSTLADIFNVIDNYFIEDIEGIEELTKDVVIKDLTLTELKEIDKKVYDNTIEILDQVTYEDLDIYNYGNIVFDCDYIEEAINEQTYESLAYWTVYFKPDIEDIEAAEKAGLTPFKYQDEFYLALSGCGMDLSPKLDAYIALVYNTIPSDSQFFNDQDYFKYVVGDSLFNEIQENCKLQDKKYIISFNEKVKTQDQELTL